MLGGPGLQALGGGVEPTLDRWVDWPQLRGIRADPLGSQLPGERLLERPLEPRLVLLCQGLCLRKPYMLRSPQSLGLCSPSALTGTHLV